jgi:hypothetical protein
MASIIDALSGGPRPTGRLIRPCSTVQESIIESIIEIDKGCSTLIEIEIEIDEHCSFTARSAARLKINY